MSKAVVTKAGNYAVNKKENDEESEDKSTDSEGESETEEGVEIWEAYLGEKKGAQVKKYNLGEMSQEQQRWMKQILQKYEDIFASELDQLGRTSIVQYEINTKEDPLIKQ
ncbi:1753_t:CDS:2, partial [Gigaspora margarita]